VCGLVIAPHTQRARCDRPPLRANIQLTKVTKIRTAPLIRCVLALSRRRRIQVKIHVNFLADYKLQITLRRQMAD